MNARSYRAHVNMSPLDFQVEAGLVESSVDYYSEPVIMNNMILLMITKTYVVMYANKKHNVLSVQSIYEIPPNEIKSRENVYEFYKDAMLGLNEVYQAHRTELPDLPKIVFPALPVEAYQREIDRVFNLLNSRN